MALEYAYILSNLLGFVDNSSAIGKAFAAYDNTRRFRAQKVVAKSRDAGEVYGFEGKGVGDDVEILRRICGERYKSIWEEVLEDELAGAMDMLGRI